MQACASYKFLRLSLMISAFILSSVCYSQENPTADENETPKIIDTVGKFSIYDTMPPTILFDGEITRGDLLEFRRALRAHEDVETIILNSPGGLVYEGMELASVIHDKDLNTIVASNGDCASACSFMYFAGKTRFATANQLGVHQFSNIDEVGNIAATQLTTGEIIEHLNDFDTPPFVFEKMLLTKPESMYYFDQSEISEINTASAKSVAWATEILAPLTPFQTAGNSTELETKVETSTIPVRPNAPSTTTIAELSYNSLRQLQFSLAIQAKYSGIIDGEWGAGSQRAFVDAVGASDSDYANALKLIEIGKIIAQRDGWEYVTSTSGMSLLLPTKKGNYVDSKYFNTQWVGYNGDLVISYEETELDTAIDLHLNLRDGMSNSANSYWVEKENRIISSHATESGWIYVRSELKNGWWSTIIISNNDELPLGIANTISASYDKRGYTFDLANW